MFSTPMPVPLPVVCPYPPCVLTRWLDDKCVEDEAIVVARRHSRDDRVWGSVRETDVDAEEE